MANFDELTFFAQVKSRPGMYLGSASLRSLRDQLFGMDYAFSVCGAEDPLKHFHSFVTWYHENVICDLNGYACWWNHILYISGNDDTYALKAFFDRFEQYLLDQHDLSLPDA